MWSSAGAPPLTLPLPLPCCHAQGYGTVLFGTTEEAQAAIDAVNGTELEGRILSVKVDQYA